jgi:hypothetical protein
MSDAMQLESNLSHASLYVAEAISMDKSKVIVAGDTGQVIISISQV